MHDETVIVSIHEGHIKLRYQNNRVEFLDGDHRFAHLEVNGSDHPL